MQPPTAGKETIPNLGVAILHVFLDTAENEPSGDVDLIRHETTQVEQYHAVSGRHRRHGCDPDCERSASLFSAPASVTGGFLAGGREKTATRR